MENKVFEFDRSHTLDCLENDVWGEPTYSSYLVRECHRLRTVPLNQFTTEDLCTMIGQKISLPYLIPIALEVVGNSHWVSSDFHGGDLLFAILCVPLEFWLEYPEHIGGLELIMCDVERQQKFIQEEINPAWLKIKETQKNDD